MPFPSSAEQATNAAKELSHALQHPTPAAPFANIGDATLAAINQLSTVLTNNIQRVQLPAPQQQVPVPAPSPIPITPIPVSPPFSNGPNLIEDDQGNLLHLIHQPEQSTDAFLQVHTIFNQTLPHLQG